MRIKIIFLMIISLITFTVGNCHKDKDDNTMALAAGLLSLSSNATSAITAAPTVTDAPSAAVIAGGLAYHNHTTVVAGGSGTNPSANPDFARCKSCHGWDTLGINGGYVRRRSSSTRPGLIDAATPTATTTANVVPGGGDLTGKTFTTATIGHASGRAFTTENGTMPNYTATGGLSSTQIANVISFLNYRYAGIGGVATLSLGTTKVAYTFTGANTTTGKALYTTSCAGCHGANGKSTTSHMGNYFDGDGKYSEGYTKILYGFNVDSPTTGSIMTRAAMGNLTPAQVRDILAYIQAQVNAGGGDFGDLL